jgi:hypothetical protein
MMGGVAVIVLLMCVLLTGCGGDAQEASATDSTAAEAASETPSPSPTAATEAQVASVVAGYQKDWREIIKKAADCRWDYTMMDRGVLAEANRMTCYMQEVTAGTSAGNAIRDLDALTIPDSLTSLVSETETALQAVADVDLEAVCGPVLEEIKDTRKCSRALGTRYGAYQDLDEVLDKWGPYL